MKKINQATLLLVALLGLSACGGGSSSETQNDVKQEQTSTQPQKKDITITGSVEKGPFVIGSTVTINILDENGENTDSTIVTKTTDDLGNFEFKVPEGSIIQITAAGYYRNEITGALSEGQLSLRSIYKATSDDTQSANVNLLTHLTSNRVLELIKAGETDFDKAISQAEEEFSANFQTVIARSNNESFSELSIYADANSDDNAYLLTLSSMLYQHAIDLAESNKSSAEAELTSILNELESDFGTDGKVDNTDKLTAIQLTQKRIDPAKVTQHLIDWLGDNSQFTVPDINAYLDTDLDGIANNKDDDDDNDGIADEDDTSQFVADFVIDNQNISLAEDETVSVEIATNNPLGTDETIKFELISDVSSGSLNIDYPNISYTPVENYNGKDEFTFKLIQGNVESKLVTFSIDVTAVNDAPTIEGKPDLSIIANSEYSFLPSIFDIEGEQLNVSVENLPKWLTFDSATGELRGTPTNAQVAIYNNIKMSVSDGSITSKLSTFSIEVTYSTLEAPVNLKQANTSKDKLQEIQLSWDKVEFAKSYTVEISLFDDFSSILQTETTELNNISLEKTPNHYFWRVKTVNPIDQEGFSSEIMSLEAGVFTRTYGGLSSESVKTTISTDDGSFITLASTNSLDLNSNLNGEDDWIFKINSQGQVEWEFFYIGSGRDRLRDLTVLEDGSILAVGQDWDTKKSIVLKLSPDGNKTWEKLYRPDNFNERYDFSQVIEVKNKVYVVAIPWICTSSSCNWDSAKLHSINPHNGVISGQIQLPAFQGAQTSPRIIKATKDDKILLSGDTYADSTDPLNRGAFMFVLNDDLSMQTSWNNQGQYELMGADDIIELRNGSFALIGGDAVDGDSAVVTLVNNKGEFIRQKAFPDLRTSGFFKLVESEQGHIHFAVTQNGQVSIAKLDQNLNVLDTKLHYSSSDSNPSIHSTLINKDGTHTVTLIDKNNNKSIAIIKK